MQISATPVWENLAEEENRKSRTQRIDLFGKISAHCEIPLNKSRTSSVVTHRTANWLRTGYPFPKPSIGRWVSGRAPTNPTERVYTLSGRPWTGRWSHSPPDDRSGTGWRRRCLRDRGGLPTSFYRGPRRPPDIPCLVVSSTAQETAAGRPSAAPPQVHYKLEYYILFRMA